MLNVTLRQLQVFAAVARHLSFARAAEELHLTAPAVSMQIKELENVLGLSIFDRSGRTITLTTPGEYFLLHARRMLGALKDAEDTIARLKGAQSGKLTLGLVSTAKYFVPRMLAEFRREHPGVEFRLEVGNRQALVDQMQRKQVDLAIMGRPPRELDTRAEPFAPNPLVMVAAPEHPLAHLPNVPPALLANEVFLVREIGSGTRAAMDAFFKEKKIHPAITQEMPSNETIKQAVMANMGVSFLSLHTMRLEIGAGVIRLLDVEGLPLMRLWHIVNMHAKVLSPAAEAFRYFVLERGQQMLAEERTPPAAGAERDDAAERHAGQACAEVPGASTTSA
jgi:LysR family transcriptional regulator, low CO2-responsive transcriptional regulator